MILLSHIRHMAVFFGFVSCICLMSLAAPSVGRAHDSEGSGAAAQAEPTFSILDRIRRVRDGRDPEPGPVAPTPSGAGSAGSEAPVTPPTKPDGPETVVAQPFQMSFPVDCTLDKDCWVTSYTDVDPTSGVTDWRCGPLSKSSHNGTDIGVGTMTGATETDVLAVAPGKVIRTTNSVTDINVLDPNYLDDGGDYCGNQVVLDHGNGWATKYCHLAKGSVSVSVGDWVERQAPIGAIGLSGNTEHPHLHLTVFHDREVYDPFRGRALDQGCGPTPDSLWAPDAQRAFDRSYHGVLIYNIGFSTEVPNKLDARAGDYEAAVLSAGDIGALVLWTDVIGVAKGDRLEMVFTDSRGTVINEKSRVFADKGWTQWFGFSGRRVTERWSPKPGVYRGTVQLFRPGLGKIMSRTTSVDVQP